MRVEFSLSIVCYLLFVDLFQLSIAISKFNSGPLFVYQLILGIFKENISNQIKRMSSCGLPTAHNMLDDPNSTLMLATPTNGIADNLIPAIKNKVPISVIPSPAYQIMDSEDLIDVEVQYQTLQPDVEQQKASMDVNDDSPPEM